MIFGLSGQQFAAFAIIIAMLALFIWDRFRYDLVAVLCLLAATLIGVVPAAKAFNGFLQSRHHHHCFGSRHQQGDIEVRNPRRRDAPGLEGCAIAVPAGRQY